MKKIDFKRITTVFRSMQEYPSDFGWVGSRRPVMLCASATMRLFKLTPGTNRITAVFTKTKPKGKCYRLKQIPMWGGTRTTKLDRFRGGFFPGVTKQLNIAYAEGERYVRIQETINAQSFDDSHADRRPSQGHSPI